MGNVTRLIFVGTLLSNPVGCANHSNDPQGCRERTARYIGTVYPDPNALATALEAICGPFTAG
jgi:hypothetical protein